MSWSWAVFCSDSLQVSEDGHPQSPAPNKVPHFLHSTTQHLFLQIPFAHLTAACRSCSKLSCQRLVIVAAAPTKQNSRLQAVAPASACSPHRRATDTRDRCLTRCQQRLASFAFGREPLPRLAGAKGPRLGEAKRRALGGGPVLRRAVAPTRLTKGFQFFRTARSRLADPWRHQASEGDTISTAVLLRRRKTYGCELQPADSHHLHPFCNTMMDRRISTSNPPLLALCLSSWS